MVGLVARTSRSPARSSMYEANAASSRAARSRLIAYTCEAGPCHRRPRREGWRAREGRARRARSTNKPTHPGAGAEGARTSAR
eukprot:6375811-Prymnesium_polylepis.2